MHFVLSYRIMFAAKTSRTGGLWKEYDGAKNEFVESNQAV